MSTMSQVNNVQIEVEDAPEIAFPTTPTVTAPAGGKEARFIY
jgi:hypothetical protein